MTPALPARPIVRTAKTLMQRAGVLPHVSGHAQARTTYDTYDYLAEKRHAVEALAATVDRIVNPPGGGVGPLRA